MASCKFTTVHLINVAVPTCGPIKRLSQWVSSRRGLRVISNVENWAKNTAKCKTDNVSDSLYGCVCVLVCVGLCLCVCLACVCKFAVLCCASGLVLKAKSHLYSFEINLAFMQGTRRASRKRRNISSSDRGAKGPEVQREKERGYSIWSSGCGNIWRPKLSGRAKQWINTCTWHTFASNTKDEPNNLLLDPSSFAPFAYR